jgi:diacylglycerol O-acyltransferase / wax synthase
VLAAVAGGLGQLLAGRGKPVDRLVLRAMVPISLHQEQPGQARGNQPGWMMVPLPLGEPDPVRRLQLIAVETAARTHQARPQTGSGIFRFVAGQRAWYRHFPRQRSVNLVVTNVPGPPAPLYLAGARLLELFPVVPVMGNLTSRPCARSTPPAPSKVASRKLVSQPSAVGAPHAICSSFPVVGVGLVVSSAIEASLR